MVLPYVNPESPALPGGHGVHILTLGMGTTATRTLFDNWCHRGACFAGNPSTLKPRRSILTLNPQPSTLNPQPSTPNPQPSTPNPQP